MTDNIKVFYKSILTKIKIYVIIIENKGENAYA